MSLVTEGRSRETAAYLCANRLFQEKDIKPRSACIYIKGHLCNVGLSKKIANLEATLPTLWILRFYNSSILWLYVHPFSPSRVRRRVSSISVDRDYSSLDPSPFVRRHELLFCVYHLFPHITFIPVEGSVTAFFLPHISCQPARSLTTRYSITRFLKY